MRGNGNTGEFPLDPESEGLGWDTEEDVLRSYGHDDEAPEEEGLHHSPELIEQIALEVSKGLAAYGWQGVEAIDGQRLIEICDRLGIAPESERVLAVLEDIGFAIERENYEARLMDEPPGLEEIERYGERLDGVGAFQDGLNLDAYSFLRKGMKDPMLDLPFLRADRDLAVAELEKTERLEPKTMEEFDAKTEKIAELREQLAQIEAALSSVLQIEDVTERRERAIRRMHWLVTRDFMTAPLNEFFAECKKRGLKLDFDLLAGMIAGRYAEEPVVTKLTKKEDADIASSAEEIEPAEAAIDEIPVEADVKQKYEVETDLVRVYKPGLVDQLLQKHLAETVDQSQKTEREKKRDAVMLRRLLQAQAVCRNVFQNDITDRIYLGSPITPSEYEMLNFIKRRLYVDGETEILGEFVHLLPGSNLRRLKDEAIDNTPLAKFSGRSKNEIIGEIDTIITEHPEIESDYVAHLVEGCEMGILPASMKVELAIVALKILEKLAFKENHSVRSLVSNE